MQVKKVNFFLEMPLRFLSLKPDLKISEGPGETVYFQSHTGGCQFRGLSGGMRKVIEILSFGLTAWLNGNRNVQSISRKI